MNAPHILVLGSGSVGRRHAWNFHLLGCRVACMDPRRDRLDQAGRDVPLTHRFTTLEEALLAAHEFTGVAVCSPPRFHMDQCRAVLQMGLPILLEKPASVDADSCRSLAHAMRDPRSILLGYSYRWWEPIRRLKALLDSGAIGAVRHARFMMSAHLADWHPWERYQDFFMASRELGGGALLDESHFIDLMLWFFGMPERIFARIEKISDLEIDTDDAVDIVAGYPGRLRATIHLDLFGRPHEKRIVLVGEEGTAECGFDPHAVRLGRGPQPHWETQRFLIERNDMFLAVAREFIGLVNGNPQPLTCTLADGLRVMDVIEACRESQRIGAEVAVPETQHA
jgi:predicted dehydrogenase